MNIFSLESLPMFSQATSATNAYPTGVGYASRVITADGWLDDIFKVGADTATSIGKQFLESATTKAVIEAKKRLGYTAIGPVVVDGVPYYKMLNLQKQPVLINSSGVETPVTPTTQAKEQTIDPVSGKILTGAGIGLGVVALGVVLYLITRRK